MAAAAAPRPRPRPATSLALARLISSSLSFFQPCTQSQPIINHRLSLMPHQPVSPRIFKSRTEHHKFPTYSQSHTLPTRLYREPPPSRPRHQSSCASFQGVVSATIPKPFLDL